MLPAARTPDGSRPPADPAAAVADASDRGARIAAVVIALAWHAAIALPAALGARAELAAPAVVLAGWLLVAATGVLAGFRLLRGAPLPAWPVAVLLLLVDAVVFAAAGEQQLFTAGNWVWGTLGWFFVLAVWGRRASGLIALLGAHSLIALAGVLGHGATAPADLARYAMYVYGTSTLPVAVFVGSTAIAGLARQRAGTAAAAHAAEAERDAAERARRERRARLTLASGAAEEVLAELADGRADPADADVQRRAVLAAARLRRLIAESDDVPDPLLHELRAAVDLAERNGLPIDLVTIGSPPPLPVEVRRRLADPLTATLADARGWARLTVVAGPDEVVVSLVTPDRAGPDSAGPLGDDGRVEYLYERDGEIRWAQTRWQG
ncbi:hypothetical protein OG777_23575 [Micromonospora peucetia]|uniref:Histidine kinase n=1 Tax=Micromonospora peucetia TaxID=47871 RepID=A0ABZ1ENA2_9ACTN|nr:hypothetical protein [Micromonospora peucetia]MCX4389893.1 hypothetical protein [Micromonospora peucetia]WSA35732.1 hypothetical protein OIE14_19340 [Micromonospora peucetia]